MPLSEIAANRKNTFIAVTQQIYMEKGKFPTFKDYYDYINLTKEQVIELLSDEGVQHSLSLRGVTPPEASVFDPRSIAAIFVYSNPFDKRSLIKKLEDIGVTIQEWNGWMRNPAFKGYLMNRTRELFSEDTLANAQMEITKGVAKGSLPHLRLYFDIKKWEADRESQIQDTGVFLTRVIEVIQKHVKSPELIKAIAKDFEAIVAGRDPVQIPGEIERNNGLNF